MEIKGTRVLILGGSGLVGMAVARDVLRLKPMSVIISALTQEEAEEAVDQLRPLADGCELSAEWGNLFVPLTLKDADRNTVLHDPAARTAVLDDLFGALGSDLVQRSAAARTAVLDDLFGALGSDLVQRSTLGDMILRHRPEVIVDCVNTATGFAYADVFKSVNAVRESARRGPVDPQLVEETLMALYVPHLIHHVWVALTAMTEVGTRSYVKVGTAGSGGMGLNIPFTHSEDRPSRTLLAKSALAGAHTLLLYLMARTPGAPAVKEVKPTAAISWKRIGYGEVMRRRKPIPRVDAAPVALDQAFGADGDGAAEWHETGETLDGVFLDAGENGLFSPGEFEALTALGLMEFITPEEISRDVVREILGQPTGRDVVGALDAATSGPTYRAGILRQSALAHMDALEETHGSHAVAYEMLGPPRLAKLLFEADVLRRLAGGDLDQAAALEPDDFAARAEALVREDADLRTRMLSIGLPVLLSDGRRVLRGPEVKVPPEGGGWDAACDAGWVDLRAANWTRWRGYVRQILREIDENPGAAGGSAWDLETWHRDRRIRPGALAAWIFRRVEEGERIKR